MFINKKPTKSYLSNACSLIAVLQIRRGKRDNLEIIFHITSLKHML